MATKKQAFPHKTTLRVLSERLRGAGEWEQERLYLTMASRALLELALASFGDSDLRTYLKRQMAVTDKPEEKYEIMVHPGTKNGTIRFSVSFDSFWGNFLVEPKDFDVSRPEERKRFEVYRSFVDLVRRVPLSTKLETRRLGVFAVFCQSGTDNRRWKRVWEAWEHAHSE